MKKTLIALLALAGVACAFDNVSISFDGTLPSGFTWAPKTAGAAANYVDSGLVGYGKAIDFNKDGFIDTEGDYKSIINGSADADFSVVTTVKFESWVELTEGYDGVENRIFLFGSGANNASGLGWYINNGNMGITLKTKSHNSLATSPGLELNTWYTLALSYSASNDTATFYVNGESVGTLNLTDKASVATTAGLGVGSGGGSRQGLWDGQMADFKLFNSALTADQVAAYGAPVAIPEPATATLSLLALAGLCARRRRA